jgi:hypothetical protein
MTTKQKIMGMAILIGLPLLLLISIPHSSKSINTKTAADTTDTQSTSGLSIPDTASSPSSSTSDTTSTSQAATQSQTVSQQYDYTPVSPTTFTPEPVTPLAAPTSAPSDWINTAGFLSGTYHYVVTYVPNTGQETGASPTSLGVSPNNQRVWVTNIPTSPNSNISERNLYRTLANSSTVGPYYLVTSFYDNTTTNYYDNTPDNILSAGSPKYF